MSSSTSGPEASAGLMPAAFLGHGSPMNTLEVNRYTSTWRAFGASTPRPRAILAISAHWFVGYTAVTAMARPKTIHDFFGFPQELFDVQYPAPGDEPLAEEIAEIAKPTVVGLDRDAWGLDHGTWSVLVHAFPKADVPVVQLSINGRRALDWHFQLATRLAPLRARGVLIVASGNVVHNLRSMSRSQPDAGFDWARRFNEAARAIMVERPEDVASLEGHPDYGAAVPTPDHFLPLAYAAGLAAAEDRAAKVLVDGYAYGSISMDCYGLDATCPPSGRRGRPADELPGLPDPALVPPEDANI